MSHLYLLNYASSTVTSYISAIHVSYIHKIAGVANPADTMINRQILKGSRKLLPAHDVPITLPLLKQIISPFKHTTASAYQIKLLLATCSLAFLRIGVITVATHDYSNFIGFTQLEF